MKIALYIEDGLEQIVLTPESDIEMSILGKLHDGSRSLHIHRGSFYDCRGGWVRHKETYFDPMYGATSKPRDDESTLIVLRKPAPEKEAPEKADACDVEVWTS